MLLSKSFIPILKNNPSEAKIKSHQLMLRVGMIKQASAGIYSWLPLGFKVMKKIETIVRQEQDKIGACLLYTSPSPRDQRGSRMPSSA